MAEERLTGPGDLGEAIEAAQLLVAYAAESGLEVEAETVDHLVEAKYRHAEGTWTAEAESTFWRALDAMSRAIHPVTIASLRATRPAPGTRATRARRAVVGYQVLAFFSLLLLLAVQIYWLIGSAASRELADLFQRKEELRTQLEKTKELKGYDADDLVVDNAELEVLQRELRSLEEEQDANYEMLRRWNVVWSFGASFEPPERSDHTDQQTIARARLEARIQSASTAGNTAANDEALGQDERHLQKLELMAAENRARRRLFFHRETADLVLSTLRMYVLPLLYGLLGAVLYVLRTLSKEIRELTFSGVSEVNFRLRVTLGALAGLAVGWFFTPDAEDKIISALALSFLAGYNVEVLFSLMDKVISNLVSKDEKPAAKRKKNRGRTETAEPSEG